jgi:anti-anti-sigma regulatory factor
MIALIITSIILTSMILLSNGLLTLSEIASSFIWDTLGGNVYRSSFVVTPSGAMTATPTVKWTADLTEQHYAVNVNPLVVDINGDGVMEVIFVDSSGTLIVVSGTTGSILLSSFLALSSYSTPTAYDVDGDGWLELIAITRFSEIVALKFPSAWSVSVMWRFRVPVDQISSSPLVYDVDGDGRAKRDPI